MCTTDRRTSAHNALSTFDKPKLDNVKIQFFSRAAVSLPYVWHLQGRMIKRDAIQVMIIPVEMFS